MKIHSRDWISYYKAGAYPLKLRVIKDDGVQVTPDEQVKITPLKKGKKNLLYKHFLNVGDGGITFKVNVLIHKNDYWPIRLFNYGKVVLDEPKVTTILKKFYNEMTVISIVTDFIDIPNGNYLITKNPSRVQSTENYTVWELEFTTYRAINTVKYVNNNTAIKNAIAKTKKKEKTLKERLHDAVKAAQAVAANNAKLDKCKLSQLTYSKKKKNVACVKYMQKILYRKGFLTKKQVDGWYGPKTKEAVKKFQKKYKKKYNLKVTGKVDKNTKNALVRV